MDKNKILKGDDTADFLKRISTRLSGREDCKYTEFKVRISKEEISMDPLIYVFPDTHHRAEADKMSVLTFLMQELYDKKQHLTSGTYEYQYQDSGTKKRRRWIKVK